MARPPTSSLTMAKYLKTLKRPTVTAKELNDTDTKALSSLSYNQGKVALNGMLKHGILKRSEVGVYAIDRTALAAYLEAHQ